MTPALKYQHGLYVEVEDEEIRRVLTAEFNDKYKKEIQTFQKLLDLEKRAVDRRVRLLHDLKEWFKNDVQEIHPEFLL